MFPLSLAPRARIAFTLFCSLILAAFAAHAQSFNETVLYNFSTNANDGNHPGSLIRGQDGSLYGTASTGGTNGYGTVFRINRNGTGYGTLHYFVAPGDCANPESLLQATNGVLYGAAAQGGTNGVGAIFELNTNGDGYAQLHAFSQPEGIYPINLFLASNGVFFGCASEGGISNAGTIFRINLDGGGLQVLHQFTNSPDGAVPITVILGNEGALYGTASSGGISNAGVVFKMDTNGNNYAILHAFTNSPDGSEPDANLIQGRDGMLYGTTVFGGSAYQYGGTFFKLGTNGAGYTVLHSFPSIIDDGVNPYSVIQGSDGFIYGVVGNGGHFDTGSVFKANTNGTGFSVVFSFGNNSPAPGYNPSAPLVEAGDGAFYGATGNGGTNGEGTIVRLTLPLMLSSQVLTTGHTNKTILSWPLWATGYGVRTSPSLASNATWTALTASITNGGKLYMTNTSTSSNAFFRLQSPP